MIANQKVVDSYVDRAVEEFERNPVSRRLLRRIADELPAQFSVAALRHLEGSGTSDAYRTLTLLMMRHGELFELVANPALSSRDRAIRLMKRMMAFDRSLDISLARRLPGRDGVRHQEEFEGVQAARVLDVLDEVSDGRRLVPILSHLVNSEDPKIAAKATLFVGRRVQSVEWATKQLSQRDPRSRSSAVEAIWGLGSPAAIRLLESCVADVDNRVAGNAVMGLHILQQPGVAEMLQSMAASEQAGFRSTAAWVMGQVATPDFVPILNGLLKDSSPVVRSTALRALIGVRRAEERVADAMAARARTPQPQQPAVTPVAPPARVPELLPAFPELRLDGASFASRRG